MLLRLAPRFRRIDGVDLSPEIVAVAERRVSSLPSAPKLFVTDGQDLPSELDGSYDVAYSVICLQHVCVHSVRRRILAALFRALKPGGLLTFQMGYGPGHPAAVGYSEDYLDAPGTNGMADVAVVHPGEIGRDLAELGFEHAMYGLTPTGPGDRHGAWIFVRAVKPGCDAAVELLPCNGFLPLEVDAIDIETARSHFQAHARSVRNLEDTICRQQHAVATLERDVQDMALRMAIDRVQLERLRLADQPRVRGLIDHLAASNAQERLRIGVLGAGAHTGWLLNDTALGRCQSVFLFDTNSAKAGSTVAGHVVRVIDDIPTLKLDVIVVSSLAFQDEMVATLRQLGVEETRILRCYP